MPRIPAANRPRVGGEVNQGLGDASQAELAVERRNAQGLAQFGQGVGRLGQGISQYQKKRESLDKAEALAESNTAATIAAEEAFAAAKDHKDVKADGSNWVELYEREYDKRKKNYLKNVSKGLQGTASTKWGQRAFLQARSELFSASQAQHLKKKAEAGEKLQSAWSSTLISRPDQESLAEANESLKALFDSQLENSMLNEVQHKKLLDGAKKRNARSVLDGLVNEGKFGEAERRLKSGDLNEFFQGSDEKGNLVLDNALDELQREKVARMSRRSQSIAFEEQQLNKIKREQSEQAMTGLGLMLEQDIPRDNIISVADSALNSNMISRAEYNSIINRVNKVQGRSDDYVEYTVTNMMDQGVDLQVIKDSVNESVASQDLSHDRASILLRRLQSREEQIRKDGEVLYKRRTEIGKDYIDSAFGSKSFLDRFGDSRKRSLRTQAMEKFYEKLHNNSDGKLPADIALEVINDMGGLDSVLSNRESLRKAQQEANIPLTRDSDEVVKMIKDAVKLHKQGKMTSAELSDKILLLENMKRSIELRDELKSRATK